MSRSRAACIALNPFFALSISEISKNQRCKSTWLL